MSDRLRCLLLYIGRYEIALIFPDAGPDSETWTMEHNIERTKKLSNPKFNTNKKNKQMERFMTKQPTNKKVGGLKKTNMKRTKHKTPSVSVS